MNTAKKIVMLSGSLFFLLLPVPDCKSQQSSKILDNPFQNIAELAISSEDCILEGRHLWVTNEVQTLNPDFTVIGGISKIYRPPLNLSPFQFEINLFNTFQLDRLLILMGKVQVYQFTSMNFLLRLTVRKLKMGG